MEDTVKASCTNCNQKLSILDPARPRGTKIPLVLQCSHTVCERCLMSAVREKGAITCSKCQHESKLETPISTWSKWEDTLTESFPLNLYLLGAITVQQQQNRTEDKSVRFVPAGASLTSKPNLSKYLHVQKEFSGCVECEKEAVWICQTCNDLYCNQCFIKCHQFKSQSKHVKLAYTHPKINKPSEDLINIPSAISLCAKHNGQKLDFHCMDCDLYCCSYCVAVCEPAHIGHTVRPLSEIVKEIRYKLLVAKEEGTAQMNLITEELSLVNEGFDPLPNGLAERQFVHHPKKTLESIINHFAFLHGRLQTLETKLINEVQSFMQEEAKNTDNAVGKLCEHLNDLSFLLQESDKAMKRDATIEMIPILKQLTELKEAPYIIERSDSGQPIRFLPQESIVYDLDNHTTLELPPPRCYTFKKNDKPLLTSLDLEKIAAMSLAGPKPTAMLPAAGVSSNYTPRTTSVASVASQPQSIPNSGPSSKASSICDGDSDIVRPRPASYLPAQRGCIQANTSEAVKVSHICNLSSFYILRIPDEKFLQDLSMRIQKTVNKNKRPPSEVKLNCTYLVEYGEDNRWYRARVKELRGDMVEVFYIDYGNSECVSKTKLRNIPKEFMNIPPMAIHCSFANIFPPNGVWAVEAIQWFAAIVDSVTLLCRVFAVLPDICLVDLGQLSADDTNNIPLSISDAVLFLEWGQMVKDNPISFSQDIPTPVVSGCDSYLKQTCIPVGQTSQVMVSHIESPSHLYVQQVGLSTQYIVGISKELNDTYFQPPSSSYPLANRAIYSPTIGMACAVQFSTDKQWYRAQVTGLPGHKTVEVQYVDYGNKEIVSYINLRRLLKRSLRVPPMATLCSLSDVAPIYDDWTNEAKTFLTKTAGSLVLNMHVNAQNQEDKNKLQVSLYESTDESDISVNALLVQMGHAVSTGPSSACVETVKPSTLLSEAAKQTMLNVKPKKLKDRKRKESTVDLEEATANIAPVSETDPYKLEVKLLKAQDPDSIYIVVKYHVPHIENMIDDMQSAFAGSVPAEIDWQPGMNCACKRSCDGIWYRGVVMEVDAAKAKVHLNDLAESIEVELCKLRELPSHFGNQPIPIKCRLAGIIPTGGSKWSRSACEFVEEFVKNHQTSTYISKQGDIENNLLPVEVFICETYTPGPLDPTVTRWYTLNEQLISAGLAMPKRGEPKPEPTIIADVMLELGVNYIPTTTNSQYGDTSLQNAGSTDDACSVDLMDDASVEGETQKLTAVMRRDMMNTEEDTLALEWLPAIPIEMDTFQAIPTYVDDEGIIYLHDYQSMPKVKEMQAELQKRFQGSHPRPEDSYWHPGQLCVAQYHLDGHWYRAQYLQCADDSKGIVTFVDYGNVEYCDLETQLRKCAFRVDIPILAQKCYLYNVEPIGVKWTTAALDSLHILFVEHRCSVVSRSKPEMGKPLLISLNRHDLNLDASTMLVEGNHARFKKIKMPLVGTSGDLNLRNEKPIDKSVQLLCALAGYPLSDKSVEDQASQGSHDDTSENDANTKDDQYSASAPLQEVIDYLDQNKEDSLPNDTSTQESSSGENSRPCSESGDSKTSVSRRGPRSQTLANLFRPNPLLEKISLPTAVLPNLPGSLTTQVLPDLHGSLTTQVLTDLHGSLTTQVLTDLPGSLPTQVSPGLPESVPTLVLPDLPESLPTQVLPDHTESLPTLLLPDHTESLPTRVLPDVPDGDCSLLQWYDIVAKDEAEEKARQMRHSSSSSSLSQDSSDEGDARDIKFHPYDLPTNDEVEVTVLSVQNSSKVYVTCYENTEMEAAEINKFINLMAELQKEAPKQPQLFEPSPGTPCVACFSNDNLWYRAKVIKVNSENDTILVQYVDYSNCEAVPFDRVVEIKREWTEMPTQVRECILWHIVRPDHASERDVVDNLEATLLQQRFLAIIKEREPVMSAVLMNLGTTDIAFETLLETQMLLMLD